MRQRHQLSARHGASPSRDRIAIPVAALAREPPKQGSFYRYGFAISGVGAENNELAPADALVKLDMRSGK